MQRTASHADARFPLAGSGLTRAGGRQQLLYQRVQQFLVRGESVEVFFHTLARPHRPDLVTPGHFLLHQLGRRKNAHAGRAKGPAQRTASNSPAMWGVMASRSNHWSRRAQRAVAGGQQHRDPGQRPRENLARRGVQGGRRLPGHRRRSERVAAELDVGVGRRGPVRQDHVEPVQRQVTEQVLELVLVAQQPEPELMPDGLQKAPNRQLGRAVEDADRQPHRLPA